MRPLLLEAESAELFPHGFDVLAVSQPSVKGPEGEETKICFIQKVNCLGEVSKEALIEVLLPCHRIVVSL